MGRTYESMMEELEVIEILSTAYDGDEFPGYENIRLSFSQLETIIRNKRSGWLDALRNQKAVYLITDTSNGTLNKAIRRIIRDCNDEQLLKDENAKILLPHFSCHSLRHTFTTRMCEAGVNVKVIQDTLGHKDISTTLNIYTDVTKELRRSEFEGLDSYFKNEYNKAANI